MIITIICPINEIHEFIDETSPIWVDAQGRHYKVASGIFDQEIQASDVARLADNTLQIIASENGLQTLAEVGLHSLEYF